MKVLQPWIVLSLGFFALLVNGVSRCKHNEVELHSNDSARSYYCRKCISCPTGEGPSKPCGAEYPKGTQIQCIPCIDGKNYSHEHSISSCQPCPVCGGKETLQTCTHTRKSICSNKCRLGFIMNFAVDDCVPDPSYTTTFQQPTTARQTQSPGPTTIPRRTVSNTTAQVQEAQGETHETPNTKHHRHTADNWNAQPNSNADHSKDNKIILVVMCIVITIVALVICGLYLHYKGCFRPNARKTVEEVPLASTTPTRSSQDLVVPWSDSLRLKDIGESLRYEIGNQICVTSTAVKSWNVIGEKLGLDRNMLLAVEVAGQKQNTTHGEVLFTKLASEFPDLTLGQFVKVLEELGRRDVVHVIKTHYNNENNKVNTMVQSESLQSCQENV